MVEIRCARPEDRTFWYTLDRHLPEAEFDRKVQSGQCYVLTVDQEPRGVLRYNLFWDSIPFCTLLYIDPDCQRQGLGRQLMARWEANMKAAGHTLVLTSTQSDEAAQHFYRRLGYRDCGGLVLTAPGHAQPMELILCKEL